MKNILLLGISVFAFGLLKAQQDIEEANSIYRECLQAHIEYLLRSKRGGNLSMREQGVLYVEQELFLKGKIPDSVSGYKVEFLDSSNMIKLTKKKDIEIVSIRPPEVSTNQVIVHVIDFNVSSRRGKRLYFGNMGGSELVFKFNCDSGTFVMFKKRQGGF